MRRKTLILLSFALLAVVFFATVSPASDSAAKALYDQARKLAKKKQYPEAEELLLKALEESSEHIPSLYTLSNVYSKQGKTVEQVKILKALQRLLEPLDKKDKNRKKYLRKTSNKLKKILKGVDKVNSIVDKYLTELHSIATEQLQQKNYKNTRIVYNKILKLNPGDVDTSQLLQKAIDAHLETGVNLIESKGEEGWRLFVGLGSFNFTEKDISATCTAKTGVIGAYYKDQVPQDFKIEYSIKFIDPGENKAISNFIFNFDPKYAYMHYVLNILPLGTVLYFSTGKDREIEADKEFDTPLEYDKFYKVTVFIKGETLKVYLGNEKDAIIETTLKRKMTHRRIGFAVADGTVSFSNITLWKLK